MKARQRLGLRYVTPFLFETEVWVDDEGHVEASIETEFQLSKYWAIELGGETEEEWFFELDYRRSPNIAVSLGVRDSSGLALGVKWAF